jgi:hypothetical protein
MATTSFTAPRRFAGFALTLLCGFCLLAEAAGQGAAPLVSATSAAGLAHPTGFGTIQQTAIDSNGDWVVVDLSKEAVYEFPAGGGAAITLVAPGDMDTNYGPGNAGILIDPGNNLYLEGNYNNCLLMFPYSAATNTWPGLSAVGAKPNNIPSLCVTSANVAVPPTFAEGGNYLSTSPYYFQPWGIAVGINNNLLIGGHPGASAFIFSLPVTGAWTNPVATQGAATMIINDMTAPPISIAQDPEGNIYFVEDYTVKGFLPGLYEIPAGTTGLTSDAGLTRVDPMLPNVSGVITDAAGNLYISDSTDGVFMVPNPSGTPQTSAAVMLTSVPAQGEVAFDWTRDVMYVPTTQTQANGQGDVAVTGFGYAELGSAPVGTSASPGGTVTFGFNSTATPSRFVILESGAQKPDFTIDGGTCAPGTAYAAQSGCLENIAFTPTSVGNISAKLLMQTAQAVPTGSAGYGGAISAYSASGGILTLGAPNSFVSGELVTISAPTKTDALYGLNGQQFNVLPTGLTNQQFQISTTQISGSGPSSTGANSTSAVAVGYIYTTVSTMQLHGVGLGANVQTSPAKESGIGANLLTPSQVAVDGQGNVYVADAGLGKVLMFPAGSSKTSTPTTVGTGLTAPTGVAIDGAGNIFIADFSNGVGSVYEMPYVASGLGAAGGQQMLVTGLGSNLSLAADGLGNLYIADPSNKRVVKLSHVGASTAPQFGEAEIMLTAGFTAPSAVAVDENNNLYVIDSANLFELAGGSGAPVALLNNLSGASGLAVDPSGAVYVSSLSGTTRIPSISGALVSANQTAIASDVSNVASVALDRFGNVYLVPAAGPGITLVSTNGTLTLPTPATLTASTSSTATVTNTGNEPLLVTGYTNTSSTVDTVKVADFTAADGTCLGDSSAAGIPAGGTCSVDVTFSPGPGEQGSLTAQIGVVSNAVNAPLTINTSGMALPLGGAAASIAVSSSPQVIATPLTVTIAPQTAGGTIPTGTIALSYQSWTAPSGVIVPVTVTVPATLDSNGVAKFDGTENPVLAPVLAGTQTFTVGYLGDRVYGRATATATASVAKSAVTSLALPNFPDPTDTNLPFVLQLSSVSGAIPYDGSQQPWQYNYKVTVNAPAGVPTGTLTFMDNSSTCPPGTSATGIGAATCALTSYSGVACPQSAGSAVLSVEPSGASSAQVSFSAGCLPMLQNTTYTPIISTHYITPVYSGDANFLGITGASVLVQAVRSPAVQITTSSSSSLTTAPSLTVQAGSSTSIALNLSSILGYGIAGRGGQLNDYDFPVALACTNLPPHSVCTFSYPPPDEALFQNIPNVLDLPCPTSATPSEVAGGAAQCTPGQVTVTINTDITVGTTTASRYAGTASIAFAAIYGFGMFGLFFRRRAFQRSRLLLMVVLMLVGGVLAGSLTACSTTNLSPQAKLATPAGTYAVTITAQQVGSQTINLANGAVEVYGSQNQVSLPFYVNLTVQ